MTIGLGRRFGASVVAAVLVLVVACGGGISVANGQVYINTYDGYLYAFGLKK